MERGGKMGDGGEGKREECVSREESPSGWSGLTCNISEYPRRRGGRGRKREEGGTCIEGREPEWLVGTDL